MTGVIRESASRPVRVEIESYGAARNDRGQEIPCRLDDPGVDALLSSIPQRDARVGQNITFAPGSAAGRNPAASPGGSEGPGRDP